MVNPEPKDPRAILAFALEKYPERVEMVPLEELVTESARQNDKRPAYVRLEVPDDVVKSVRGRAAERDTILIVRVPREVAERMGSRIILPGEIR